MFKDVLGSGPIVSFCVYQCLFFMLQLSLGHYAFKVAVSSENGFGEGFVNVTVKPGKSVSEDSLLLYKFISIFGA